MWRNIGSSDAGGGGGGAALETREICVGVYRNEQPAKVGKATAAAVDQRAAAGLHVQSLGPALEECPREAAGRLDTQTQPLQASDVYARC